MAKGRKGRKPDVIRRDRAQIAALYCQGVLQIEIASRLGLSQQQVSYDLLAVRRQWLESSLRDFNSAKAEQLAKLDRIEGAAWEAFERSRQTKEITVQARDLTPNGDTDRVSVKKENQVGDPRFLEICHKCVERRCRILGLDAPEKRELTGPNGQPLELTIARVAEAETELEAWRRDRLLPTNGSGQAAG